MKAIGSKTNESSSTNTSAQDRKGAKSLSGDNIKIVMVFMGDRAAGISIENDTTVDVCVSNVIDYR